MTSARYTAIATDAARRMLASAPASALHAIAARGARIASVQHGTHVAISGNVVDAALSALRHYSHGADGRDATAASVSKALRADDAPACRWALDRDVTGALVRPMMRVRRAGSSPPKPGAPTVAVDVGASRIAAARSVAIRDLTLAFQARARNTGAARKSATSQIRAILRDWASDAVIQALCAEHEWSINAG